MSRAGVWSRVWEVLKKQNFPSGAPDSKSTVSISLNIYLKWKRCKNVRIWCLYLKTLTYVTFTYHISFLFLLSCSKHGDGKAVFPLPSELRELCWRSSAGYWDRWFPCCITYPVCECSGIKHKYSNNTLYRSITTLLLPPTQSSLLWEAVVALSQSKSGRKDLLIQAHECWIEMKICK